MRLVLSFVPRLGVAFQFVPGCLGEFFLGPSNLFLSFRVNTCQALLSYFVSSYHPITRDIEIQSKKASVATN